MKKYLVICVWNEWQIGECSKTCAGGMRTNTRTKKVEEAHGGTCQGEASLQETCNAQKCPRKYPLLYTDYYIFRINI